MPNLCVKIRVGTQTRNAHLHGEERLFRVGRIPLEEAREKVEVGTWGIEPIELACASSMEALRGPNGIE
jgi:hypothetical protein